MGLLEYRWRNLNNGININNKKNKIKLLQWRKSISHVPQDIFSDSSIKDNIIFGRKKIITNLKVNLIL